MRLARPGLVVPLFLLMLVLAACAPSGDGLAEQVATSVAATMQASGQPVPTAEPTLGEVATHAPADFACANTGLVSVAYVKDANVWLWVEGGMRTQLTFGGDVLGVAISQSGCRIAYTRSVPNPLFDPSLEFPTQETLSELWVVNSDGTGNHALADTAFLSALPVPAADNIASVYQFRFQPGTHNLAFNTLVLHPGVGLTLSYDLFRVSADAGAPAPLLAAGMGGGFFAFSPDGSQIAFSTHTSINVVNADGSGLRTDLILFPMVITFSEYLYSPPISWTPDGVTLVVAVPPEDGLSPAAGGGAPATALWRIPLDGTPAFAAGSVQSVFFSQQEVTFSPDAGRIAYLRPVGVGTGVSELVTALSDGSGESPPLGGAEIRFVAWALDSTRYLYSYQDGGFQLRLVNAADSSAVPVATLGGFAAFNVQAVWADATRFVLLEMGGGGGRLSLLDSAGGPGELIDNFVFPIVPFAVTR